MREQILQDFKDRGALYHEINYCAAYATTRIRREHKGWLLNVCMGHSQRSVCSLLYPEGYEPDSNRLSAQTGEKWTIDVHGNPNGHDPKEVRCLIDSAVGDLPHLAFFDESKNQVTRFDRLDFDKVVQPKLLQFCVPSGPGSYRAKQERIAPTAAGRAIFEATKCFVGVSLENENFDKPEMLEATVSWIADNFSQCLVVVGDSIHRLTLQNRFINLDEGEALRRSVLLRNHFLQSKLAIFHAHAAKCQFQFRSMTDPAFSAEHAQRFAILEDFASSSLDYSRIVRTFAQQFVARQIQGLPAAGEEIQEARIRRAYRYILEEAAYCGLLAEGGWDVLVYPGPLDQFRAVSEGEIPDAPEFLRRLRIVSLKLKRQWLPGERARINYFQHE